MSQPHAELQAMAPGYVLGTLDLQGRIRTEVNSDGFSPSEGAAFLLLALASTARAHGLEPLAEVLGC